MLTVRLSVFHVSPMWSSLIVSRNGWTSMKCFGAPGTYCPVIAAISGALTTHFGIPPVALQIATAVGSFVVIAFLFAVMFRYLPDARISWRDVRAGAIGTALLFVGLYLGRADPGSVYGAAGSLALVLIWVYYTSMILLFGAEFTKLWAQRYGKGIVPIKGAVAYVEEERSVAKG